MSVRTHSLRQDHQPGVAFGFSFPVLVCRGCGTVWPDNADVAAVEREPCGTQEGP